MPQFCRSFEELKNPGDFYWPREGSLRFKCPCGCGIIAGVDVKPIFPHGWDWDGNVESPTVKPSILINQGHWHGFLTNGVFA